jgi:rfaE bifunctional protein kinase chain/domain
MLTLDRLSELLSKFPRLRIGLVGDLFLDRYLEIPAGNEELSIETGLEAYQVTRIRNYPGALGTVMNNLAALGVGQLLPVTVIGRDGHGFDLLEALSSLPVDTTGIVQASDRLTPTYTKPMRGDASGAWHELNRLDVRTRAAISADTHAELVIRLEEMFATADGVIVLDQLVDEGCGVVDARLRQALARLARRYPEKLIYTDSRAHLAEFMFGVLKGNRGELLRSTDNAAELRKVMLDLSKRNRQAVFCTLGEEGIAVALPEGKWEQVPGDAVPPPIDVCGAGDAATSGIVASMLSGATAVEAASVGNLVASITVQQLGTTGTATPEQVLERMRSVET